MDIAVRFARVPVVLLLALLVSTCRSSPTAPVFEPLTITTQSLPAATRGEPYAEALRAEGGDGAYEWDISAGNLPIGLQLSADDLSVDHALITGSPAEVGTSSFTVRVQSGDGQTATQDFSIAVVADTEPLAVLTRRVPPALEGAPYAVRLRANGGNGEDFVWQLVGGRLPTGLTLTAAGRIEGTPATSETTTFAVEVRSGGETAQQNFQLRVVQHDTDAYRITIFEVTDIPESVRHHVQEAIAQWEAAVIGNLPPVAIPEDFFAPGNCGGFGSEINGTSTNDLLIILNVTPIDGPGGVLGRAGPCGIRQDGNLPFAAIVTLDADDLTPIVGTETLTDIIAHEIAHALGFGTLWELFGLVEGAGTDNPRFTGQQAMGEYTALGGSGAVPLENQGGEGTREVHWRKTSFHEELMTGFIEPVGVDQPISRVTIASWEDLGYTVDMAAADDFTLAAAALAPHAEGGRHMWGELGYDVVYRGPVVVLGPGGEATILELR